MLLFFPDTLLKDITVIHLNGQSYVFGYDVVQRIKTQ